MKKDTEFVAFLIKKTISWICKNREFYRPKAKELDKALVEKFSPYFPWEVLKDTRVYLTKKLPKFDFLDEYGFTDFTKKILKLEYKKGVIFIDTLLISTSAIDEYESIVFYLLVHLTLYKIIGYEDFVRRYVNQALLENYNVKEITLERNAANLTDRFLKGEIFDVTKELEKLI